MLAFMRFDDVGSVVGSEVEGRSNSDGHAGSELQVRLEDLLSGLAAQSGYETGSIGRSPDQPGEWVVATSWEGAGKFRRALSDFEVKIALGSLANESVDLTSVFETVVANRDGEVTRFESFRSPDAETSGPGPAP
jgi:hypothetical protein